MSTPGQFLPQGLLNAGNSTGSVRPSLAPGAQTTAANTGAPVAQGGSNALLSVLPPVFNLMNTMLQTMSSMVSGSFRQASPVTDDIGANTPLSGGLTESVPNATAFDLPGTVQQAVPSLDPNTLFPTAQSIPTLASQTFFPTTVATGIPATFTTSALDLATNNNPVVPASALPPATSPGPAGSGPDAMAIDPFTGMAPANPVIVNPTQNAPSIASRIDPNMNFQNLSTTQRSSIGLTDVDRAILHLWGRQMIIVGHQNGAILNTVLDDAANGGVDPTGSVIVDPTEVAVAQQLAAMDMSRDGGIDGRALDQAFFQVFQKITGADISQRYANAPVSFANGQAARFPNVAVDSPQFEQQLEAGSGLNEFENALLRTWGHDPLFNGGKIDGSILAYTMASPSALDAGINKDDIATLMKADLASENGAIDGRSIKDGFLDVMDRLYGLRSTPVTPNEIMNNAVQKALNNGQTMDQISQNVTTGFSQAMGIAADMVKNHPVITGMGAAGLAAAASVCPFLAGLGAGAAGIALGQQILNNASNQNGNAASSVSSVTSTSAPGNNPPITNPAGQNNSIAVTDSTTTTSPNQTSTPPGNAVQSLTVTQQTLPNISIV